MSKYEAITSIFLFSTGVMILYIAAAFTNDSYATILLGQDLKYLSWGPALFRALLIFHAALLIFAGLFWKKLTADKGSLASTGNEVPTSSRVWFALALLSLVALALRLWNLNSDLWVDEVFTLLDFVRQPMGEIITSFPSQNQHMLYSVAAKLTTSVFGESAWSLRLPAVIFGLGSIWALFLMCRRLLGVKEALYSCALMAVSYHHIWFSQNARGYTGLLFFTLLATWLWFEALSQNKWRLWIAYATAIALGMWIHMTMIFVVGAHGLVYLTFALFPNLSGKKDDTALQEIRAGFRPFAAWLLSITFSLQLYALSLPEFLRIGLYEESKTSEWTNPIWVITESVKGLSIGFAGMTIVAFGAALVIFGWMMLFIRNRRLAILLVLPGILAGATMLSLGHNIWPRFFFFSMGFALMIVVYGALKLPEFVLSKISTSGQRTIFIDYAGSAAVLLIIMASLVTLPKNYALPKQDFSGARNYVESNKAAGDEIVAVGLADDMYSRYFAPQWLSAKTGEQLEKISNPDKRIWLVYTLPIEIKAFRPDVWQVVQRDYEIVRVFPGTLSGGEIFVSQKKENYGKSKDAAIWQQTTNVR